VADLPSSELTPSGCVTCDLWVGSPGVFADTTAARVFVEQIESSREEDDSVAKVV
jgi:hypothetical protein